MRESIVVTSGGRMQFAFAEMESKCSSRQRSLARNESFHSRAIGKVFGPLLTQLYPSGQSFNPTTTHNMP